MTYAMLLHALEGLKSLSCALATPSIAVFAAWIAYQQFRIQKYRLFFDLRDRQLRVFYAVRQLIRDAISESATNNSSLNNFRLSTAELSYFFNPVTVTYVEELEARFLRMLDLKELIGDEADGNPEALKQAKRELREIRQSMRLEHGRLQAEFRPYLELPASFLTLPSTRAATMKW
jgi:hypothetical protein